MNFGNFEISAKLYNLLYILNWMSPDHILKLVGWPQARLLNSLKQDFLTCFLYSVRSMIGRLPSLLRKERGCGTSVLASSGPRDDDACAKNSEKFPA